MAAADTPDLRSSVRINTTDWGPVTRVDVNQLAALVPEQLRDREANAEARSAWGAQQNDAIIALQDEAAAPFGGGYHSYAECTTLAGRLFEFRDMIDKRRARFDGDYPTAISGLSCVSGASGLGGMLQSTAYLPTEGVPFAQRAWQPECIPYRMAPMALAFAVTTTFGGSQQLFLSVVTTFQTDGVFLHGDDPQAQVRWVLERIIATFEEAGGSRDSIMRLRSFASSGEAAAIVRANVDSLWSAAIKPTNLMVHDLPMAEGRFVEILAYGVLADGADGVEHRPLEVSCSDPGFVARACRTRDVEIIQAGEFLGGEDLPPAQEARQLAAKIGSFLAETRLTPDDVCVAFTYAGTVEAAAAFQKAAADVLNPSCLHVVPVVSGADLTRSQLRVELTARRR